MTTSVRLDTLVEYLDDYLQIREVPDHANALNGLQVANGGDVSRLVAAVDACQATIDHAADGGEHVGPTMLLVHHGLFWDGPGPVTGRRYRRLRALMDRGVALYSAHIPLDVHAEVGNNAVLARELGLEALQPFGRYQGIHLGLRGSLDMGREELASRLEDSLGASARLLPGGPARTRRVALITGAAGGYVREAMEAGCDTFITGEGMHHIYFDAMEFGVNVIFAGHYATEQVGVRALADHLSTRFGLPWVFHHHPTGL